MNRPSRSGLAILFFFALAPLSAAPSQVTVSGRKLLVNGQVFTIQGVNYSPTPVGNTVQNPSANCVGPYHWWTDRPTYVADFPQIQRLGANTLRTFDLMNSAQTPAQVLQALDQAQASGLHVIMGYSMPTFQTFAASSAQVQSEVLASVHNYMNHPAVLMWALGNEVNLTAAEGGDPAWSNSTWYNFLNQLAGQIKTADPHHPIVTMEGEIIGAANGDFNAGNVAVQADDAHLPNVDMWGINAYRGKTFEGLIQRFALSTTTVKAVMISEFGKDAFRDSGGIEDQDLQSSYLSSQWTEVKANLSATTSGSQNLVGGAVFEWTDEWWKDTTDDCQTHGAQVVFVRSDDTVDPNYQNEWFGISAVGPVNAVSNPGGTNRALRKGYTTLQGFWNPGAAAVVAGAGSYFSDTVRNYPNPFRIGSESTKFVVLVNEAGSFDIRVYDAGAQFVTSFSGDTPGPGRFTVEWDGHNHQGAYVSPGLYFAKIHGHSASHDESQYRRVVGVK